MKTYGKPSEQIFPKRRLLGLSNLTKIYIKNIHKVQTTQKRQRQNIKQLEPLQKYRLGTKLYSV